MRKRCEAISNKARYLRYGGRPTERRNVRARPAGSGIACQFSAAATASTFASPPRGPTVCRPNGIPAWSKPPGKERAGCPTVCEGEPMEIAPGRVAVDLLGIEFRPWARRAGDRGRKNDVIICEERLPPLMDRRLHRHGAGDVDRGIALPFHPRRWGVGSDRTSWDDPGPSRCARRAR